MMPFLISFSGIKSWTNSSRFPFRRDARFLCCRAFLGRGSAIAIAYPPIMKCPAPYPVQNDVRSILEQRIAAQPHQCEYGQRQQRDCHHRHFCGNGQMQPHQLWISYQCQQNTSLYRVPHLQQAAQQLAGVGVVGRYCVNITVFSIISHR